MVDAPNHFSMVGFAGDVTNTAAINRFAQRQLAGCTPQDLTPPDLVCVVRDASGAELRLGLRKGAGGTTQLMTLNPSFVGEGRMPVEVHGDPSDPAHKPFEVTVYARFAGEETPIVFDLADPAEASAMKPGAKVTVSLAAFSYEPELYATEGDYYRAQKKRGTKVTFAANYFVPSGTFMESVGGTIRAGETRPEAYADFAGKVVKAELRSNAAGGAKFWWALVQTYKDGVSMDVVMDPASVREPPKPGHIISGRFWLTGRKVP